MIGAKFSFRSFNEIDFLFDKTVNWLFFSARENKKKRITNDRSVDFFSFYYSFFCLCVDLFRQFKKNLHLGKKRKTNRNERFLFQYESSCC